MNDPSSFRSEAVDDLPALAVAPGVVRRQLLTTEFARGWVIDFAPGSEWPQTDVHDAEERYFVLSGEIIEGEQRYPAGTHVVFDGGSSHRPRSEVGCRIIGMNIVAPS
jgi:anti-sigma factor ChrR (cupin superfamily)